MAQTNNFYMDKVNRTLSNLSASEHPDVKESIRDMEDRKKFMDYVLRNLPGEDVDQENLLSLKLKIEKENLSQYLRNTLVKGHGEIDISTFIVVPKNTVILTFVYEGRYLADYNKDYGGIHKSLGKVRSQAVNLLHFWIDYLYKLLEFYQSKKVGIEEIKKHMSAFSELKKKYLEKYRYHRPDYSLTNDDIVVYFQDDVIPNQIFELKNTHLPGIYNFEKMIFGSRTRYNDSMHDEQDQKSLFYQILKSIPLDKETSSVYLIDILGEMEKRIAHNRLASSFEQSKEPVNIVVLYACRGAKYHLTIKQHLSFLYKNIFYHFERLQKSDKTQRKNSTATFSQRITKRLDVLDSRIHQKKDLVYKIFYEKYCIISPSDADLATLRCLLYYEDAEKSKLSNKPNECIFSNNKLNWYFEYFPARDINGNPLDIWKTGNFISIPGGQPIQKIAGEPEVSQFSFGELDELEVIENFYLPRNINSEFFLATFFTFDNLSIEKIVHYENFNLFLNTGFREKIFNEWKSLIIPYLNKEFKLDELYVEVMYECFVKSKSLSDKTVQDLIKGIFTRSIHNKEVGYIGQSQTEQLSKTTSPEKKTDTPSDQKKLFRKYIINIFDSFSKKKSMKKNSASFKRHFQIFTTENFNTLFYNRFFALSDTGDKTLHIEEQNKNFVYFKKMYQGELNREKNFPYLTPIEFIIANYYVSKKNQIHPFSNLLQQHREKRLDISIKKKKECGMCNYNILIPVYQSLEKLFSNYKSFTFTNCIESIESFFRFHFDTFFSKYLQTGIQNFSKSENVNKYLTIFSGYFMMKLDHVLNYYRQNQNRNISETASKYNKKFVCPWINFYNNKINIYPENINYAYLSKILTKRYSLYGNKIYQSIYTWAFPMVGDQISYLYLISSDKLEKMIGIETRLLGTKKGMPIKQNVKTTSFSVKSQNFFVTSPKLLVRYFTFFMIFLNYMGLKVNYENSLIDIFFDGRAENYVLQFGKFLNFFSDEKFENFREHVENQRMKDDLAVNDEKKENNLVYLLRVAKSLQEFGFIEFSHKLYKTVKELLMQSEFAVVLNRLECESFLNYLYIVCFDKEYVKAAAEDNVLMQELNVKGENAKLAKVIKSFAKKNMN